MPAVVQTNDQHVRIPDRPHIARIVRVIAAAAPRARIRDDCGGLDAARPQSMKPLLVVILVIAGGGLAFSGYLTYRELFATAPAACSPVGEPGTIFGAPPCIYGFFMYLAIVVITSIALLRRRAAH
jgi:hypothetical protein